MIESVAEKSSAIKGWGRKAKKVTKARGQSRPGASQAPSLQELNLAIISSQISALVLVPTLLFPFALARVQEQWWFAKHHWCGGLAA